MFLPSHRMRRIFEVLAMNLTFVVEVSVDPGVLRYVKVDHRGVRIIISTEHKLY